MKKTVNTKSNDIKKILFYENLYLYFQIVAAAVMVLSCIILKVNNTDIFYKIKEDYKDLSGALAPHAAHFNMNILSSLTIFVSGLLHSWQITNFSMYSSILSLMRK